MSSLSTPLNHSSSSPLRSQVKEQAASPSSPIPQKPSTLIPINQDLYAQLFKQLDHESLATFVTAVIITLLFWLTIFLTCDSGIKFLHMPLWFVLSCLGGYFISVIGVIVLVKYFLKDMPLHPHALQETSSPIVTPTEHTKVPITPTTAPNIATSTAKSLLKNNSNESHH